MERETHKIKTIAGVVQVCQNCNATGFQLDEFTCIAFMQREFITRLRQGTFVMQIFIDLIERQMKLEIPGLVLPIELVGNPEQSKVAESILSTAGVNDYNELAAAARLSLALGEGVNPTAVLAALTDATRAILTLAAWYDLPLEHAVAAILTNPAARDQPADITSMGKLLAAYRGGRLHRSPTAAQTLDRAIKLAEAPQTPHENPDGLLAK